jgi:hypothetical protein
MPYSIRTDDNIVIDNIPDDVKPDAPELKQRVAAARASRLSETQEEAPSVNQMDSGISGQERDDSQGITTYAPSETIEDSGPSGGQIVAGVGTEIAAGIGGQLAGTAIGTAIMPGIGTAIGYGVGSLSSGILGSIAAQKLEGSDDVSWGRAIAAGLINLVPGGAGKAVKGSMTLGKIATREATKGALFGATEATSRAIIDEGRLPTAGEMATYGGVGAIFGGALGTAATKLGAKFAGKSSGQIDADIVSGEITATDVVKLIKAGRKVHEKKLRSRLGVLLKSKKGAAASDKIVIQKEIDGIVSEIETFNVKGARRVLSDTEKAINTEVAKSREAGLSREAASAMSEPSGIKKLPWMRRLVAHIAPSRIVGRLTQE